MQPALESSPCPPIAARMQHIPKSATLAINEQSKALLRRGKDVISLGLGQSPFPVPEKMVQALKAYAGAKDYMAVQGYLPLREAIAGFMHQSEQHDCDADDILIGPGSKELFFGLQMVLDCDLLLPAPSWVSYGPQARLLGRRVHWLPCEAANNWKLTADSLQQHCAKQNGRPQLLVLNSPNNPSGACFEAEELEALAAVARRHNVLVLSDEIYSELHFEGEHVSMSRFYPEGSIVSNGISKWAGAGGWRLGFMVFPKCLREILNAMTVVASETFTSVSAPVQMAAIAAFEESPEIVDYIQACRKIIRFTGEHFSQRLLDHGIAVSTPAGGFYNLPDFSPSGERLLRHGIGDAAELSRRILEQTGVAALPGSDFGLQQGYLLRMAYVDFDGAGLLQKQLQDSNAVVDRNTVELQRIFKAADRIGDWLASL